LQKNRLFKTSALVLFGLALFSLGRCFAYNDSNSNRDAYYDLVDQEKSLLRRADDLSRKIFDLKRSINQLSGDLTSCQSDYQNVNHDLITLHMKLLR
jgi:hypothetical protein